MTDHDQLILIQDFSVRYKQCQIKVEFLFVFFIYDWIELDEMIFLRMTFF